MESAKVFMNGRSEAVRLPKSCRFGSNEVHVKKMGDMVLLFPKNKAWDVFMEGLAGFSDDFMSKRPVEKPQKRVGP
jgi:antitoxin VapB